MLRNKQPLGLYQTDLRWCKSPYTNPRMNSRTQTIGSSGCGLVSAAMMLNTHRGLKIIPPELAKLSVDHGFRTDNEGTSWDFFPWIAKRYSLRLEQTRDIQIVKSALKENALIICSMTRRSSTHRGYFTSSGHFILLWGQDDKGRFYANDPISKWRTNVPVDEDIFLHECRQYFVFYKPKLK